jgi:hypothetical protein
VGVRRQRSLADRRMKRCVSSRRDPLSLREFIGLIVGLFPFLSPSDRLSTTHNSTSPIDYRLSPRSIA